MSLVEGLEIREVSYPADPYFLDAAKLYNVTFHDGRSCRYIEALYEWRLKQRYLGQTEGFRNVQALHDDRLVGIGSVRIPKIPGKHFATIESVAVDRDFRGYGVGRSIVGGLENIALESDALGVILSPTTAAVAFYKKLGFENADFWQMAKHF